MHHNQFTGQISSTIGHLTALGQLYVDIVLASRYQLIFVYMQGVFREQIDRVHSRDHWTIDRTQSIVRYLSFHNSLRSTLLIRNTRYLHANQFTGQIPETVGQLTALLTLYIVMLTIHRRNSPVLQESSHQRVDRTGSLDDWTIDEPDIFVRCWVTSVSEAHVS